jgi:hypothetical protein
MSCNNFSNNNLEDLLKLLSINVCKNACKKLLDLLPNEDNSSYGKNILNWYYNNEKKVLNKIKMLNNWGYIIEGLLSLRDGRVLPVELLLNNGRKHKNDRFQLWDIIALKKDNLVEYNNDLPIGDLMFDTLTNNINIVYNINKISKFDYSYKNILILEFNANGFEGWSYNDVNYKKVEAAKLDNEINKLNTEVEFILLTSRGNKDTYKLGDDHLQMYNFKPLYNIEDVKLLKQFFGNNTKINNYWESRILDETFFNSKK